MKKNNRTQFVTGILMLFFIGAFLIIAGRFIYIQATGEIENVSLEEWAKEKRMSSYPLRSERGKIFDNNGMTLAYDRPTFRVYAVVRESFTVNKEDPQHVKDIEKTAKSLAPLLEVEESFIIDRLQAGVENDSFQVEFGVAGKELNQQKKDEIIALDIPGINFERESIRYYPNGQFASHIIGFARKSDEESEKSDELTGDEGSQNQEMVGITGIEENMNDLLGGKDGYVSYQRDKYDRKLLNPDEIVKKPENGDDVYLTIDQKVQTLLEDTMSKVEEEYSPERITAIVMHAKTGEVVAMSNRPSYNPNSPSDVKNWYNDVISTPFEPGSTVKMFTWAAAIDAGVYNGDEWYKSGRYQVNERMEPIHDHNRGEGWGSITYDEGFQRSSNVAASRIVWEKLGPEKYLEYLEAFDFDKKTNIDLPGEIAGEILYNWPAEKLTTSFGQGSTLTPIQQMKAATAIANGGKMLEPHVIKKILDPETGQVIKENSPVIVGEPISEKTADQVINLLDSVVNGKNGTGKMYKLDDYSVVGKTGTSQIPNPNGPGYLEGHNNNIFSFLGMAPKDDPELIMYVSVSQPKLAADDSGSSPVSIIFKNVMENGLHYLNIEPDIDEQKSIRTVKIPRLVGENMSNVKKKLDAEGLNVTVVGSGKKVTEASIDEGDELFVSDRIILLTDKPTMPNVIGWSLRDILQLADLLELEIDTSGNGYVTNQNVEKGTSIKKGSSLKVELKSPNE